MLDQLESFLASEARARFAPTLLRAALGTVFLAHAYAKAFVFTFAGTEHYFAAHGFPGFTVYPVFAAELLGGFALIAGYRSRAVALALVPVLLGALRPHVANGWMFTSAGGGWEYVAFLLIALLVQALLGDGALAISAWRPAPRTPPGLAARGQLG